MNELYFTKMHGLGNDFVIIDGRQTSTQINSHMVQTISERHTGIGCNQVILLENSDIADIKMVIFNSDGSKAEACGNATRCILKYLHDQNGKKNISVEVNNMISEGRIIGNEYICNMGIASTDWAKIPLAKPTDCLNVDFSKYNLPKAVAVNVGNPHIVFFVDNLDKIDVTHLGPVLEIDPLFPNKVNVSFAEIIENNVIKAKVWERGAGETSACGTAACAIAFAAIKKSLLHGSIIIKFNHGNLLINLLPNSTLEMRGTAETTFSGKFYYE